MNLICSELFIYIHKRNFFSIYIFTAVLFVYNMATWTEFSKHENKKIFY